MKTIQSPSFQHIRTILAQMMIGLFVLTAFLGCQEQGNSSAGVSKLVQNSWNYFDSLNVNTLLEWDSYGHGYTGGFRDQALQMSEKKNSAGLMIVSPIPYQEDVSVSFEVMTLRSATVLVLMLSSSTLDGPGTLAIPEGFNGGLSEWPSNSQDYFFAFHNAPHFRFPFVMRRSPAGNQILQEAKQSYMNTGTWYEVEAGVKDGRLWLLIDNEIVLNVEDSDPLTSGHVSFRIRGSGTEVASCFIRNVVIKHNG